LSKGPMKSKIKKELIMMNVKYHNIFIEIVFSSDDEQ